MTALEKKLRNLSADNMSSRGDLVTKVERLIGSTSGRLFTPKETAEAAAEAIATATAAERRIAQLNKRIAELEHLAITDELTGLLNRRGFEGVLKQAAAFANRYNEGGALVYIDLDGFKPVNDTYGHAAGDAVLKRVGLILANNVRETDSVGRLGGDEFAVLLTRTDKAHGLKRAEGLDHLLNTSTVEWNGRLIAVKASLGFQTFGPSSDVHDVLAAADTAMYAVKKVRADHAQNLPRG